MFQSLRLNVLILAGMLTGITVYFGMELIGLLDNVDIPPSAIIAVVSLLVGVGLGSLGSSINALLSPPPPGNQVPESTHVSTVETFERIIGDILHRDS